MSEDFFGLPGSSAPVYAGVGGMQRLPRAVLDASGDVLQLQRETGNHRYTDKFNFVFVAPSDSTCTLLGCSESQVTSVADFGTNYCNLRMLYCGSADGCTNAATPGTGEASGNRARHDATQARVEQMEASADEQVEYTATLNMLITRSSAHVDRQG